MQSFIVHVKTVDIYKEIGQDVETRFDTSNYKLDRPFPRRKRKRVIELIKDELGGKVMKESVGLAATNHEDNKAKGTKKCDIKRKLKFEDYKNCLEAAQIENEKNHLKK